MKPVFFDKSISGDRINLTKDGEDSGSLKQLFLKYSEESQDSFPQYSHFAPIVQNMENITLKYKNQKTTRIFLPFKHKKIRTNFLLLK